eukprot:8789107-Pyramimonas_sp.AAC.1
MQRTARQRRANGSRLDRGRPRGLHGGPAAQPHVAATPTRGTSYAEPGAAPPASPGRSAGPRAARCRPATAEVRQLLRCERPGQRPSVQRQTLRQPCKSIDAECVAEEECPRVRTVDPVRALRGYGGAVDVEAERRLCLRAGRQARRRPDGT